MAFCSDGDSADGKYKSSIFNLLMVPAISKKLIQAQSNEI